MKGGLTVSSFKFTEKKELFIRVVASLVHVLPLKNIF